jgi:DNA-binding transcriptional ArsR family regulator
VPDDRDPDPGRGRTATALAVLAHPSRLRLLAALAPDPRPVRDLARAAGLRAAAAAGHLRALAETGLAERWPGDRYARPAAVACGRWRVLLPAPAPGPALPPDWLGGYAVWRPRR